MTGLNKLLVNKSVEKPENEGGKDVEKKEEEVSWFYCTTPLFVFLIGCFFLIYCSPYPLSDERAPSLLSSWLHEGQFNSRFSDVAKYAPEQLHQSLGPNVTEIYVTWSTLERVNKAELVYILFYSDGEKTCEVRKRARVFRQPIEDSKWPVEVPAVSVYDHRNQRMLYTYRALVSGLTPLVDSFIYRVETYVYDSSSFLSYPFKRYSSKTYQSSNQHMYSRTLNVALFGDLGLINAQSLPRLIKDVDNKMYDLIIHNGDFAYDLNTQLGQYGDQFMRMIEPIAARVPYQTSVGNHEIAENFTHYNSRFTMVNRGGVTPGEWNNFYYSFNAGPVHFVAFSTEFYYYLSEVGEVALENQYKWLEKDLKLANSAEERAKRPWIIVFGHRPMYCSSNDNDECTRDDNILRKGIPPTGNYALEKLFYDTKVDVEFYSHEHQYERFLPLYDGKAFREGVTEDNQVYRNPRAPVHVISGSAGCQERLDPFKKVPAVGSVKRSTDYGYTRLKASPCSLEFRQVSDDDDGHLVDKFTIEKDC